MKLQKRFLRKHNGKDYYKYIINLPPETLKQANFKPGDELEAESKLGEIRLKKKR